MNMANAYTVQELLELDDHAIEELPIFEARPKRTKLKAPRNQAVKHFKPKPRRNAGLRQHRQ